jgi:glutaredoxin 2
MAHRKEGWLANTTMTDHGIFASNGEALISGRFAKSAQDEFNGKPKAKKVVEAKKPVATKTSFTDKIKKKLK